MNTPTEIGRPGSLTRVGIAEGGTCSQNWSLCVLPILMQLLLASATWLMSGCELHFSRSPTNEKRSIAAARARIVHHTTAIDVPTRAVSHVP